MESFFKNPGFLHIGEKFLKNLDFKTQVSCRLVQKSWKSVLDKLASKVGVEDLLQILQRDLLIPHKELHNHSSLHVQSNLDTIYDKWSDFLALIDSEEENPWIFVTIKRLFKNLIMIFRTSKKDTLYSPFNTFTKSAVNFRALKFILQHRKHLISNELNSASLVPVFVENKQIEVMAILKPHLTNLQLRYATYFATQNGQLEILKLIITESDSNLIWHPCRRLWYGKTLVHEAAERGHAEVVEFLLTQTRLLATDKDGAGETPLATAVRFGRAKAVKIIAEHLTEDQMAEIAVKQYPYIYVISKTDGSNGFTFTEECCNLFQIAAEKGCYDVLKELCRKVPNPNVPGANGNTATHIAARKGRFEIVKLLTSYTSKANTANDLGVTPAGIARSNCYHEIANLLNRMGRKRKFDELN